MRVTIAGAGGGVGASVAFNLLRGSLSCELVLLDRRPEMIASHLMDLEQVLEQEGRSTIRAGDLDDLAASDVVVVAASAPLTVNESRMVYLGDNAVILAALLDALPPGWPGVLILVTNPVDPLCTWARRRTWVHVQRLPATANRDRASA
jgi:malate dehydrogenase